MLKILFGDTDNAIYHPPAYFDEYRQDDVKIGAIISDTEQCLYIGNKLYSARTNKTPDKTVSP